MDDSYPILAIAVLGALTFIVLRRLFSSISETPDFPDKNSSSMSTSEEISSDRPITETQLSRSKGENGQPLYIAVKDPFGDKTSVFDVSSGRDFYGPGAGYHVFVGRDATYGLATSSLDPDKLDGDLDSLTQSQKDTHIQWYEKYVSKYPIVGHLVSDKYTGKEDVFAKVSKKDA